MTDQQYYQNSANWGSYQYVTLDELVNNYMLINVGDDQLISNIRRYKALFYAKEAVKEMSFDTSREARSIEYIVGSDLKMILPHDYVNYVKLSLEINGILLPMSESLSRISTPAYVQDANNDLTFDINGNVITGQSELDIRRIDQSLYSGPGVYNNCMGWCFGGNWYFDGQAGGRFGLETDRANVNGTFTINKRSGVIDFANNITGQRVVLEYISDGLEVDDSEVRIHKMAEKYVYAYITWCILDSKVNIQEYIVRRARDKKSSLLRNLKIRLSNIKAGNLLMIMRGQNKQIK